MALAKVIATHLFQALLNLCDIGEDEFQIDDFDIASGVHGSVHMNDIVVTEAAHHMHDRVGHANVGQELVAQASALGGALHDTSNINKFDLQKNISCTYI